MLVAVTVKVTPVKEPTFEIYSPGAAAKAAALLHGEPAAKGLTGGVLDCSFTIQALTAAAPCRTAFWAVLSFASRIRSSGFNATITNNTRIAIIAITTKSSTRVKPRL